MLTRSMFTNARLQVADREVDPSAIARSATTLATHDLPMLVRRADVPHLLGTGIDAASDAIRTTVEQIPARRRRSPSRPFVSILGVLGILAVIAVTGWWVARGAALSAAREVDLELDEDAIERATDEGMPDEDGDPLASIGAEPDGAKAS